jgi:hypothetical protein
LSLLLPEAVTGRTSGRVQVQKVANDCILLHPAGGGREKRFAKTFQRVSNGFIAPLRGRELISKRCSLSLLVAAGGDWIMDAHFG